MRRTVTALLVLGLALPVPFAQAARSRGLGGGRPRVLTGSEADGASVRSIVTTNYGAVVDGLVASGVPRDRAVLRLGMAFRLYTRSLKALASGESVRSAKGAAAPGFVGPSPEALADIERMLPDASGDDPAAYASGLQARLSGMGSAGYKQLMHLVAKDAINGRAVFDPSVTPQMSAEAWRRAESLVAEAGALGTPTAGARRVPSDVDVPDPTAPDLDGDRTPEGGDLVSSLPPTTVGNLDGAFIASLTDVRVIDDLIAGLAGSTAPAAATTLAALRARREAVARQTPPTVTADADASTATAGGETGTSLAEQRLATVGGGTGSVPAWFDATLANMTAFFITRSDDPEAEGDPERVTWDPATGKKIDVADIEDPFDQFGIEVIQNRNEGLSQRLPGQE